MSAEGLPPEGRLGARGYAVSVSGDVRSEWRVAE